MRTTDPFDFLQEHRDTIFRVLGVLAILLVIFLILRAVAMRLGGWGAAWRRLCREVAITAHAFAAPVRSWTRHRRSLGILVRGLREPTTWRDAERALAAAREAAAATGNRPYAVLVDTDTVTVLFAGPHFAPPEREPWWVAEGDEPDYWSVARSDLPPVVPVPDQVYPVLVAIGEVAECCAFLDLNAGPPMLSLQGDRSSGVALHQALAAQLDVRLPSGQVVVAEGVHPGFDGQPIRSAYRAAAQLRPYAGLAPVLVSTELPDPLPPELTAPPDALPELRVLVLGPGRGYVRTLLTDRFGQVAVLGTPLVAEGNALARAIVRVLSTIPPVLPPAPPGAEAIGTDRAFAELDEEEEHEEDAEESRTGITAVTAALPRPPVAEVDDEREEVGAGGRDVAAAGEREEERAEELEEEREEVGEGNGTAGGAAVARPGGPRVPVGSPPTTRPARS